MRAALVLFSGLLLLAASPALAGQPLETESAFLAPVGTLELEAGLERQTASEGTELHFPLALSYVPTTRLELLVEPVVYSRIRDPRRLLARGMGDVEITGELVALSAEDGRRALAVAGEVKLPTAKSRFIGSGRADYAAYLIGSQRISRFLVHANLSYTFIGHPPTVSTRNVFGFGLAAERRFGRFDAVAEVLGSTAALVERADSTASGGESATAPEIGGEEIVGTGGVRYRFGGGGVLSAGVSLDNKRAWQVHPGISWRFR